MSELNTPPEIIRRMATVSGIPRYDEMVKEFSRLQSILGGTVHDEALVQLVIVAVLEATKPEEKNGYDTAGHDQETSSST